VSAIWSVVGFLLLVHLPIGYGTLVPTSYQTFARSPYCAIDPSCVSVTSPGSFGLTNSGFATHDFEDMNTVRGLALANYTLFLAFLTAVIAAVARATRRRAIRYGVLAAVCVFALLEVNRWFDQIPGESSSWVMAHLAYDIATVGFVVGVSLLLFRRTPRPVI
jgi:heme A synthase